MMGSRGWRGAQECDVLSIKSRRMMSFGRGVVRKSKRSFWKRSRKTGRQEANDQARSLLSDLERLNL